MRNHLPGFARQNTRIAQRKPETCTTSGLKLPILLHNPWYKIAPANEPYSAIGRGSPKILLCNCCAKTLKNPVRVRSDGVFW